MAEQERKIAAFNAAHGDSRPSALAFNQQMAASTNLATEDAERQLAMVERTRGDLLGAIGCDGALYPRDCGRGDLTTPATQLKALEAKYAVLSGNWAQHPDIVKLRRQIDALKAQAGGAEDSAETSAQVSDLRANLAAAEKTYGPQHPDVLALRRQLASVEAKARLRAENPTPHQGLRNWTPIILPISCWKRNCTPPTNNTRHLSANS